MTDTELNAKLYAAFSLGRNVAGHQIRTQLPLIKVLHELSDGTLTFVCTGDSLGLEPASLRERYNRRLAKLIDEETQLAQRITDGLFDLYSQFDFDDAALEHLV